MTLICLQQYRLQVHATHPKASQKLDYAGKAVKKEQQPRQGSCAHQTGSQTESRQESHVQVQGHISNLHNPVTASAPPAAAIQRLYCHPSTAAMPERQVLEGEHAHSQADQKKPATPLAASAPLASTSEQLVYDPSTAEDTNPVKQEAKIAHAVGGHQKRADWAAAASARVEDLKSSSVDFIVIDWS